MFHALQALVGTALMERATLLINHVLASEPVAAERMRPHAGSCIQLHFDGWPQLLPPLPTVAFRVTPAGLLEWTGAEAPVQADLRVTIDGSNPALAAVQALTGARPRIEIAGDAGLATDVNWLFDNLRWDVEDDLARIVGPAPAREIARLASAVAGALREAVRAMSQLAARGRGRPAPAEPAGQ